MNLAGVGGDGGLLFLTVPEARRTGEEETMARVTAGQRQSVLPCCGYEQ